MTMTRAELLERAAVVYLDAIMLNEDPIAAVVDCALSLAAEVEPEPCQERDE